MPKETGGPLARVLVADDSALVRTMLKRGLQSAGYEVDEAEDGAAALAKIEEKTYDVVITDLQMPKVDGFELLASVKKKAPTTEVIILTGSFAEDMSSAIRALRLGAHDYLTKPPPSHDEMLLTVERAVEKKQLRDSNVRLLKELEALSRTDALTGVLNRRAFDEALRHEAGRSLRYHVSLALGLVDLDHFKKVNDQHGHPAGDAVLRHFGALALEAFRDNDSIFRYGGEEFAVLLPHTDLTGGLEAMERLRHALESASIDVGATSLKVTCSGGVALLGPGDRDGSQLVRRVDAALYAAKAAGRNRIEVSETPAA